jgi:hypothetical protein
MIILLTRVIVSLESSTAQKIQAQVSLVRSFKKSFDLPLIVVVVATAVPARSMRVMSRVVRVPGRTRVLTVVGTVVVVVVRRRTGYPQVMMAVDGVGHARVSGHGRPRRGRVVPLDDELALLPGHLRREAL